MYRRRKRQSLLPSRSLLSLQLSRDLSSRDLHSRVLLRRDPHSREILRRDLRATVLLRVDSRDRDPLSRVTVSAHSRDLRVTALADSRDRDLLSSREATALVDSRVDTISRDRAALIRKKDSRMLPERSSSLSLSFAPRL